MHDTLTSHTSTCTESVTYTLTETEYISHERVQTHGFTVIHNFTFHKVFTATKQFRNSVNSLQTIQYSLFTATKVTKQFNNSPSKQHKQSN